MITVIIGIKIRGLSCAEDFTGIVFLIGANRNGGTITTVLLIFLLSMISC